MAPARSDLCKSCKILSFQVTSGIFAHVGVLTLVGLSSCWALKLAASTNTWVSSEVPKDTGGEDVNTVSAGMGRWLAAVQVKLNGQAAQVMQHGKLGS